MKLSDKELICVFKETSKTLTGSDRHQLQGKITKTDLYGDVRKAETIFCSGRETASFGMKEEKVSMSVILKFMNEATRRQR